MTTDVNHPSKWELDYQRGTAGWDMGTPTPVFQSLLREGGLPPGKMLVPGAGRGHDAREFARHGFEVVAVDFARDAADAMRALMDDASRHEILRQDFFQLPQAFDAAFDYVLEYTCFCAIDPTRRAEYADVVTRVLKRGGTYIALAFPLSDHTGGPPFAVNADELMALFEARGFVLRRREIHPATIKPRKGREELIILRKT
jgi:SAM-dependent methyltransferase